MHESRKFFCTSRTMSWTQQHKPCRWSHISRWYCLKPVQLLAWADLAMEISGDLLGQLHYWDDTRHSWPVVVDSDWRRVTADVGLAWGVRLVRWQVMAGAFRGVNRCDCLRCNRFTPAPIACRLWAVFLLRTTAVQWIYPGRLGGGFSLYRNVTIDTLSLIHIWRCRRRS